MTDPTARNVGLLTLIAVRVNKNETHGVKV